MVEGRALLRDRADPQAKNRARHFSGRAFFAVDGLALRYLEGTLADNPFGVKSLKLRLYSGASARPRWSNGASTISTYTCPSFIRTGGSCTASPRARTVSFRKSPTDRMPFFC